MCPQRKWVKHLLKGYCPNYPSNENFGCRAEKTCQTYLHCLGAWMSLQECGTKIIYIHTDLCSCCHFHQEYHSLLVKIFPLISQDRRHLTWTMVGWKHVSIRSSLTNLLYFYSTSTLSVFNKFSSFFLHCHYSSAEAVRPILHSL